MEKLGYTATVTESYSGSDVAVLIALHAYRSHASMMQFHDLYPNRPIALILTGTDLYRDITKHSEVLRSMEVADQLIVLQPSALDLIPPALRHKARVIFQSVQIDTRVEASNQAFQVIVIGHLRQEKNPFCTARSLSFIPADSQITVLHLGKAMDEAMGLTAKEYSTKLDRYQWLGELSHADTLKALSESQLMVISSHMEGGAHVVSEAIALGIPVIASDIPGNRGLLGDDYPGYYPVDDSAQLAKLLYESETKPDFYAALKNHIGMRRDLVSPSREMQSIRELLTTLNNE